LQQLANILDDPEASDNDRFVALELLKNANVASGFVLPGCQDTGTGIVMGKRGQNVWTEGNDAEALSRGVFNAYTKRNLRCVLSRARGFEIHITPFCHSRQDGWGCYLCEARSEACVIHTFILSLVSRVFRSFFGWFAHVLV
jgi:hypothetical protein